MKHKHCDSMLQYAKDAQETDKPWERWHVYGWIASRGVWDWIPCTSQPNWEPSCSYRRKTSMDCAETLSMLVKAVEGVVEAEQSEGGGFVAKPAMHEHNLRVYSAWQDLHEAMRIAKDQ